MRDMLSWLGDLGLFALVRRGTPTDVLGWRIDLLRKIPEFVLPASPCAGLPGLAPRRSRLPRPSASSGRATAAPGYLDLLPPLAVIRPMSAEIREHQ
jgi:hypothetical protein